MNYLKLYKSIIRKAKKRNITGYTERHHIVPKSCGGSNKKSNLVLLSAREHFIAHRLLAKLTKQIYGENHNYTIKMAISLGWFSYRKNDYIKRYKINSRTYEYLKIYISSVQSKRMMGDKHPNFGKKWKLTEEQNKRKSINSFGAKNNFYNKKHSEITINRIVDLNSKTWKLYYKNGNTKIIKNMGKFARENNYSQGNLWSVFNGDRKRHKDIIKIEKYKEN